MQITQVHIAQKIQKKKLVISNHHVLPGKRTKSKDLKHAFVKEIYH